MEFTPNELAVFFVALGNFMETLDGAETAYRDAGALVDRISEELKGLVR